MSLNAAAMLAINRFNGSPAALAVTQGDFAHSLEQFIRADSTATDGLWAEIQVNLCQAYGLGERDSDKPFAFANGVAVIPIYGTLINRFDRGYSFLTGYQFIQKQIEAVKADPEVKGVIFDVNSYGGEASGAPETAQAIASLRGVKPHVAMVDSKAYSGAYWLAAGAEKIIASPSAGVGSIGAVTMHVDLSKLLEDEGVKVTLIHSGSHKVDGSPYSPLTEQAQASMQASLDSLRLNFASEVAHYRQLPLDRVMGTEANIFNANQALDLGLIDGIASAREVSRSFLSPGGERTHSNTTNVSIEDTPMSETAAVETVKPDAPAPDASRTERERIGAIIGSDQAKGREKLAHHLAFKTDLSVAEAEGLLAVSAAEAPEESGQDNPFAQAMVGTDNPNISVGIEPGQASEAQESAHLVDSFFKSYQAATGRVSKT